MFRRPSGSPIDEKPGKPFFDDKTLPDTERTKSNSLHVKSVEEVGWTRRSRSTERTARDHTAAKGLLKPRDDVLLGDGRRRNSRDEKSASRATLRGPWFCSQLTVLTTLLALVAVFVILQSAFKLQLDPQGCRMSRMSPTYIKLSGFDSEHSRFASKYALHLYREEGVEEYSAENIGLRGAPVLFIPGNAGSYKQVRSLSSEAARHYHGAVKHDQHASNEGVRGLDFFTLDFNEDLSAFHGQTILDQAEYVNEAVAYILSLYTDADNTMRDSKLPDPSSVILIGHSMGGIVARTALVTSNYQSNSINTIITMSTPHARPPVSFDRDMVYLYERINDYWRTSYGEKWASNNPLWHTTLVSIAGGGRDTTVPSDYTSVSSLVPESHGFAVFTSSIPDVWTSMDHLAITWADQMRKVIAKALLEVVDVRRPTQTKARADRIKILRKWFLTGLEEHAPKSLPTAEPSVLLAVGGEPRLPIVDSSNVTIRNLGAQDQVSASMLQLPTSYSPQQKFVLLTDQQIQRDGSFHKLEVLFCSNFPLPASHANIAFPIQIDLSGGNPGATRFGCKRPVNDATKIPASTRASRYSFDDVSPFTYLEYQLDQLSEHQFVVIVDKSVEISDGWVYAEITKDEETIDVDVSLWRLLLRGVRLELPSTRSIVTDIRIPALHSSLLAYHLRIRDQGCNNEKELFTPLLRQHVDSPYESKWFPNFKKGDINLHGVAPFMPPSLAGEETESVAFQIWSDPTCESSLEFQLTADIPGSLGKLVIRYRTVFAAFPLLVVAMVLRKQFRIYDSTGVFITFSDALGQSLKIALPVLLMSMTFFATAFTSAKSLGKGIDVSQPMNATMINFGQNDLLLGSQDTFFWFLVPLAGLLSVGFCVVLNLVVLGLLHVFSFLMGVQRLLVKSSGQIPGSPIPLNTSRSPRRRILNTLVLLLLVATIIPYPFAYVVACIVQLATSARALHLIRKENIRHHTVTASSVSPPPPPPHQQKVSTTIKLQNFFNYSHSLLTLLLCVLPINLPVLFVWIHNLATNHWLIFTPFTSHHSVLSVAPFIVLVETLTTGAMVPRVKHGPVRWMTNLLFFVLAVYAAMFGMTYAYRLHHVSNILACWLVGLHFFAGNEKIDNVNGSGNWWEWHRLKTLLLDGDRDWTLDEQAASTAAATSPGPAASGRKKIP